MGETAIKRFDIYIRATPEVVWAALTTPEGTARYGYRAASEYDLKPGGKFRAVANAQMRSMGMAETIIDGEVLEVEAPRRLAQTYRFLFSPQNEAEGFTRLTWEVEPTSGGFTRVTLIHDLTGAPMASGMVSSPFSDQGGGGWPWILSDLKSLLETGSTLAP
jgi:uncharacterized protein YndB with AHSA1/START domain